MIISTMCWGGWGKDWKTKSTITFGLPSHPHVPFGCAVRSTSCVFSSSSSSYLTQDVNQYSSWCTFLDDHHHVVHSSCCVVWIENQKRRVGGNWMKGFPTRPEFLSSGPLSQFLSNCINPVVYHGMNSKENFFDEKFSLLSSVCISFSLVWLFGSWSGLGSV